MVNIIIGTTPTIKYTFSAVNVSDISVAYLTCKQKGRVIFEKPMSEAVTETKSLSWILSQSDTLALIPKEEASLMCNWKKNDGTRGASNPLSVKVLDNHKREVI